jgi:hypothetical protein
MKHITSMNAGDDMTPEEYASCQVVGFNGQWPKLTPEQITRDLNACIEDIWNKSGEK